MYTHMHIQYMHIHIYIYIYTYRRRLWYRYDGASIDRLGAKSEAAASKKVGGQPAGGCLPQNRSAQ